MAELKLCTYNARGLRQCRKRRQVFAYLHKQNKDIFFIQETHSSQNDERYWKAEWGGHIVFCHGSTISRGVCILFNPALDFTISRTVTCDNGRLLLLQVTVKQKLFTLVCIYGPNVDDPGFFQLLYSKLEDFEWDSLVVGGDFNFVFNLEIDKTGGNPRTNFRARDKCIEVMSSLNLVDIWRERNPHEKHFTWSSNITAGIHCRLDFFLISRNLNYLVAKSNFSPGLNSDHSVVNLDIKTCKEERGPGHWKFNNSLLSDTEYITMITDLIVEISHNCTNENPASQWEFMKYSIRKSSIDFSKKKARERRKSETNLIKEIARLEQKYYSSNLADDAYKLAEARSKLQCIYDHKVQGIIIRSRARWVEQGERNTKYFLNLESRNKSFNVIRKLKSDDGTDICDNAAIIRKLATFYGSLYTSERCDPSIIFGNKHCVNPLSHEDADSCDGKFTLKECWEALYSFSNGKSPGSDGLTAEFYKTFWHKIGDYVVNSLNYSYDNMELPHEQGRGLITLIPKPQKDHTLVKNYRPLSLLNVDYKIAAKTLASRLKKVIPSIINSNQTGFIKNRFIGESIRLILDCIDYCRDLNVPGFLLFVDFEKAFDRLEWAFIFKCLSYFGFNEGFAQWLRTLYSNASACVCNNGYSSAYFQISRGVRQGCPLSPYIFILCAEILAISINDSPLVTGLFIMGKEIRITQYADDTTIFVDNTHSSLSAITEIFHLLEKSSGLKVNHDKTNIFPLGPLAADKPLFLNEFNFAWTLGPVTVLGITFDKDRDNLFHLNYTPKLSRLKNKLNLWSTRDLTPIGRITIIKTFALSQLTFLFQVLPNPPSTFIKELETYLFRFIWAGKPDKIKRTTLINTLDQGGLGATHISSFINGLKCTWVKRYTDNTTATWKLFFDFYLQNYGKNFLFHCNYLAKDLIVSNRFISDVCAAWSKYSFRNPVENYENEIIWNNSMIRIDNEIVFYDYMYAKGVLRVKDLYDNNQRPLSFGSFKEKYSLGAFPFTAFYGILSAIPRVWIESFNVLNAESLNDDVVDALHDIPHLSRYVYRHLIQTVVTPPAAFSKWSDVFQFSQSQWQTICRIPFASCKESKIRYFQYRFIHRTLGTNARLCRMNIVGSPLCTFCNEQIESIEHLFWECSISSNFILDVEQSLLGRQFIFSREDLFFGFKFTLRHPYNFLIFHLKFYLFNKKLSFELPNLNEFLYKFKFAIQVEKKIGDSRVCNTITYESLHSAFRNCLFLFQ